MTCKPSRRAHLSNNTSLFSWRELRSCLLRRHRAHSVLLPIVSRSRVSIVTLHRTALLAAAAAEYRCNAPHCSFSPSASIPSCTMHVKQWMMCSTHIRCYTHIRLRLQHKHEIAYGVTAVHSSTLLSSKLSANANAQKKTHRHKYRLASEER